MAGNDLTGVKRADWRGVGDCRGSGKNLTLAGQVRRQEWTHFHVCVTPSHNTHSRQHTHVPVKPVSGQSSSSLRCLWMDRLCVCVCEEEREWEK